MPFLEGEAGNVMTEAEWLNGRDPQRMLEYLRDKVSDRKLRLLSCACVRAVWSPLPDQRCWQVVEVAESFADGLTGPERFAELLRVGYPHGFSWPLKSRAYEAALAWTTVGRVHFKPREAARVAPCIRCLFGNPFRPVSLDPAWCSRTVRAVADAIYEERRFEDLPILADALEEAGCREPAVLEHCRCRGPHACGCWPVDLILSKDR